MITTTKDAVKKWLDTKDFDKGVDLLSIFRPAMARIFRNRPKTYATKLEYELRKLAGMVSLPQMNPPVLMRSAPSTPAAPGTNPANDPFTATPATVTEPATGTTEPGTPANTPSTGTPAPGTDPSTCTSETGTPATAQNTSSPNNRRDNQLPPAFIARIVKEHSHLFKLRSQLSEQREKIPAKNHPTYNQKRKIASEAIQALSNRIEILWNAKEDYYEKNITPDMAVLFPETPAPKPEPQNSKTAKSAKAENADASNVTKTKNDDASNVTKATAPDTSVNKVPKPDKAVKAKQGNTRTPRTTKAQKNKKPQAVRYMTPKN